MFYQPILPSASRKKAKQSSEDSILLLAYSVPAGWPVGREVGSCLAIIIKSNRQPWNGTLQWPIQPALLFNSMCNTVGPHLKFLPSGCLTTEINVFSIGDRQVLSESVRLKKSNRKICIISSLTNLALALG